MNYYNEFDPYAAQWLRNLIDAGHLPNGRGGLGMMPAKKRACG